MEHAKKYEIRCKIIWNIRTKRVAPVSGRCNLRFLSTKVLQGSVGTYVNYGRIFIDYFTANVLQSVMVKEFWKSVRISRSYRQKYSGTFFPDTVYIEGLLFCCCLFIGPQISQTAPRPPSNVYQVLDPRPNVQYLLRHLIYSFRKFYRGGVKRLKFGLSFRLESPLSRPHFEMQQHIWKLKQTWMTGLCPPQIWYSSAHPHNSENRPDVCSPWKMDQKNLLKRQ